MEFHALTTRSLRCIRLVSLHTPNPVIETFAVSVLGAEALRTSSVETGDAALQVRDTLGLDRTCQAAPIAFHGLQQLTKEPPCRLPDASLPGPAAPGGTGQQLHDLGPLLPCRLSSLHWAAHRSVHLSPQCSAARRSVRLSQPR